MAANPPNNSWEQFSWSATLLWGGAVVIKPHADKGNSRNDANIVRGLAKIVERLDEDSKTANEHPQNWVTVKKLSMVCKWTSSSNFLHAKSVSELFWPPTVWTNEHHPIQGLRVNLAPFHSVCLQQHAMGQINMRQAFFVASPCCFCGITVLSFLKFHAAAKLFRAQMASFSHLEIHFPCDVIHLELQSCFHYFI